MAFMFYSILFGFAVVMLARSLVYWKLNDVAMYFILAVYTLMSLSMQIWWADLGTNHFRNHFGGEP